MKALRSFTVRAQLPESLSPLRELARNLRWSWDERTRDLFRWVDPQLWEATSHDPVRLLGQVGTARLEHLANDPAFMGFLQEVHEELQRYLTGPRWFQTRGRSRLRAVAYFSPEFGIAEALPQYSGGLGVLAGDHLKAAGSLGLPLTGVGLFYRQGYFRQYLNPEGWQEERYPVLDPHAMALHLMEGVVVKVRLDGEELLAQVWRAEVGRVHLYLLDADVEGNSNDLRQVTDRLYGGGSEHRLRQEVLLGVGGVRALQSIGVTTQVFHTNEGHAGFLGLERIRALITENHLSWGEAIEAVRAGTIFTTHTPVPAGIDRFSRDLIAKYFGSWAEECGVSIDTLMSLGHFPGEHPDAPFNMAVMGLRLAGRSNGVAALHGKTSRAMFAALWPEVPVEEVPIGSVTNGVHGRTWVSSAMDGLYSKYVSPTWSEVPLEDWTHIGDARDDELWRIREESREALVTFVRQRLRAAALERGASPSDAAWTNTVLDPRFLIVGFARRFAPYKRATLLLSQPDRLRALLLDPQHPLQLVFAGKAHPADDVGKEMIRRIARFAADPTIRHRIAFVENYDMAVARAFCQGADVWLNTPRRPNEASGTSGEKAAINGSLNCSILDGWWDEMFRPDCGWAISSAEGIDDLDHRDQVEANSLFEILEQQIIPLYYDHGAGRLPQEWVGRIRCSLRDLGPRVQATRMVRDYLEQMYEPVAERADALAAASFKRARTLAGWKSRVAAAWPEVRVLSVASQPESPTVDLGERRDVTVAVSLGELTAEDVAVEVIHGRVLPGEELSAVAYCRLDLEGASPNGANGNEGYLYRGSFLPNEAGRHGFAVRVIPNHPDLVQFTEMGCITWA